MIKDVFAFIADRLQQLVAAIFEVTKIDFGAVRTIPARQAASEYIPVGFHVKK